jgi:hypothetical protein
MVPLHKFNLINYIKPKFFPEGKPLTNIIGFDTETRKSGEPFLLCTSLGTSISTENFLDDIFQSQYHYANFITWNLKFDGSSIMRLFSEDFMKQLHKDHTAKLESDGKIYKFKYVPSHKCYTIHRGKIKVTFWDIQPFYGKRTRLESAASEFLNDHKKPLDANLFTDEYIKNNLQTIQEYCIHDAVLTQRLAELWIKNFSETGMNVTALFSQAHVSFSYFCKEMKNRIVTAWDLWSRGHTKLIQFASESYQGGKFEVLKRGYFNGYEYDISSAYPNEIANLIETKGCDVIHSKKLIPEAVYGFARVQIDNRTNKAIPTGIMYNGVRVFPKGKFYATITKNELLYMREIGVTVHILDAYWITVHRKRYPYRKTIHKLYDLKTELADSNPTLSSNYKTIMNSFYGKMAQCNLTPDGTYSPGKGWNPIYAAVITANVRIELCRVQNMFPDSIIAVHTDSVISTDPLKIPGCKDTVEKKNPSKLGHFEFKASGSGIMIMCGIYALANRWGTRGFSLVKNPKETYYDALRRFLTEREKEKTINITTRRVESWVEATNKRHPKTDINRFQIYDKVLTIGADKKRDWRPNDNITCGKLIEKLYDSKSLYTSEFNPNIYDDKIPSYWK